MPVPRTFTEGAAFLNEQLRLTAERRQHFDFKLFSVICHFLLRVNIPVFPKQYQINCFTKIVKSLSKKLTKNKCITLLFIIMKFMNYEQKMKCSLQNVPQKNIKILD